jgi:hypothetical protein
MNDFFEGIDLNDTLSQICEECETEGMEPPFILCLASRNGAIRCLRVDHAKTETLAETKQEEFMLPITMMVLDQRDMAAHVTITTEGPRFH